MTIGRKSLLFCALIALGTLSACDDGTGPGTSVSLSVTVLQPSGALSVASPALFDLVYSDGTATLTLSSVELVMREIELEKVDDESCDSTFEGEVDDCEEFEAAPRVFPLPMDGTTEAVLSISDVPEGLYDELEIEVHKVSDDPEDAGILTTRPDLADVSIRVEGDVDGTPFVFTTGVEEEFEFVLSPPIDPSAGPVNVTLAVDVESWFRAGDGSILDPSDEANRSEIENNIQQSFEAFEDSDGDGSHDD